MSFKVSIAVTIEFERPKAYQMGADLLQRLQNFEDIVLPLVPRLESTLSTLKGLRTLHFWFSEDMLKDRENITIYTDELQSFVSQVEGYIQSTKLMRKRSQRTLDIVSLCYSRLVH